MNKERRTKTKFISEMDTHTFKNTYAHPIQESLGHIINCLIVGLLLLSLQAITGAS